MENTQRKSRRSRRNNNSDDKQKSNETPTTKVTSKKIETKKNAEEKPQSLSTDKSGNKEICDENEITCGICFDPIHVQGILNKCSHLFCFECIETWSKTSNTCPLCKSKFSQLTKKNLDDPKAKPKKVRVKDVEQKIPEHYQLDFNPEDLILSDDGDFYLGFGSMPRLHWFSDDDEMDELDSDLEEDDEEDFFGLYDSDSDDFANLPDEEDEFEDEFDDEETWRNSFSFFLPPPPAPFAEYLPRSNPFHVQNNIGSRNNTRNDRFDFGSPLSPPPFSFHSNAPSNRLNDPHRSFSLPSYSPVNNNNHPFERMRDFMTSNTHRDSRNNGHVNNNNHGMYRMPFTVNNNSNHIRLPAVSPPLNRMPLPSPYSSMPVPSPYGSMPINPVRNPISNAPRHSMPPPIRNPMPPVRNPIPEPVRNSMPSSQHRRMPSGIRFPNVGMDTRTPNVPHPRTNFSYNQERFNAAPSWNHVHQQMPRNPTFGSNRVERSVPPPVHKDNFTSAREMIANAAARANNNNNRRNNIERSRSPPRKRQRTR